MKKLIVFILLLFSYAYSQQLPWASSVNSSAIKGTQSAIFMQDSLTGAIIVLDPERMAIHDDRHWHYKVVSELAVNDSIFFGFKTPVLTTARVHPSFSVSTQDEYTVTIYEGATVTDSGTVITTFNTDRNGTRIPKLQAFANPVCSDYGTYYHPSKTGSNRSSGLSLAFAYPIIAKANTFYLFKIEHVGSTNPSWLDVNFWWFECYGCN